jgi:hypothetical protein
MGMSKSALNPDEEFVVSTISRREIARELSEVLGREVAADSPSLTGELCSLFVREYAALDDGDDVAYVGLLVRTAEKAGLCRPGSPRTH